MEGGGAGVDTGGCETADALVESASVDELADELVDDVLLLFSFSLIDAAGLLAFAVCLEPPPMRLRRMFHLPLPGSSSGKSLESADRADAGRISASGMVVLAGVGFR